LDFCGIGGEEGWVFVIGVVSISENELLLGGDKRIAILRYDILTVRISKTKVRNTISGFG
jgi:hypothetical protein